MMKAYDIIGYAYDGVLYCLDCFDGDPNGDEVSPVFVSDAQPGDCCDSCLQYLDGCEPENHTPDVDTSTEED